MIRFAWELSTLAADAGGGDGPRLSQPLGGEVLHYRDDYGIEVDAAATNLKRFAEQIDSQRSGSPAFLAVICGKGYGYRRADGVFVVPVGVLGP